MEKIIKPTPTKRTMIDPLRLCNAHCRFCYYLHGDMKSIRPFEKVKIDIDRAKERGNNYIDVSGGESTLYPDIVKLINYAHSLNLKVCLITNGIVSEKRCQELLDTKIDEFLVSIHGLEVTHNDLVQVKDARKIQIKFLDKIKDKILLRFNFVVNKLNQNEIFDTAKWMLQYSPLIINFINMNPHGEWSSKKNETKKIIADLNIVEEELNKVIPFLEQRNIGVNIRYYPMCKIKEEFRKNICNDLHVTFDDKEWDYYIKPKTYEAHRIWGKMTSNNIERKGSPCKECDLQYICGGINKAFFNASENLYIANVQNTGIEKDDFYYYRQHNILALERS